MRKLAIFILLPFYAAGIIFSPSGNFSCMYYVPQAYAGCVAEDPDIDVADFVFEHLLSLEGLFELIEHEQDDNDQSHPPLHLPQTVVQTTVIVIQPIQISFNAHTLPAPDISYTLYRNPFRPGHFTEDVFRPPIV